jgi:hypothetical protein
MAPWFTLSPLSSSVDQRTSVSIEFWQKLMQDYAQVCGGSLCLTHFSSSLTASGEQSV